jgi:hypothetical protein
MKWVIESYDRRTDRDAEHSFATESAFISAAEDLLRNVWEGFRVRYPSRWHNRWRRKGATGSNRRERGWALRPTAPRASGFHPRR